MARDRWIVIRLFGKQNGKEILLGTLNVAVSGKYIDTRVQVETFEKTSEPAHIFRSKLKG